MSTLNLNLAFFQNINKKGFNAKKIISFYTDLLKKIIFYNKVHLNDAAVSLLVIYMQKKQMVFTCTQVFIIALFTIAKMWRQPKHPSVDEYNDLYPYNGILFGSEKEGSTDMYCHADKLWKHTKWKKPGKKVTCCKILLVWNNAE